MSGKDRIRLLTDVASENCKNFFQHVFVVETDGERMSAFGMEVGGKVGDGKKQSFQVEADHSVSFPIIYPNGGNPLHAQGVYPLPCYLLYDPHLKSMRDTAAFASQYLVPRLRNTVAYGDRSEEERVRFAERLANTLHKVAERRITQDKQLGILMIADIRLPEFRRLSGRQTSGEWLAIRESDLEPGSHLHLNLPLALDRIAEAKFREAADLGELRAGAVSTFTNAPAVHVVSVYNKSWLWLSPTWEMPTSIYWKDTDYVKGIRLDRLSYDRFVYGTQLLKQLISPIQSAVLKEMFAPVNNAEIKSFMKASSFEEIHAAPFVLPLLDEQYENTYEMLETLLGKGGSSDPTSDMLQLKMIAGIEKAMRMPQDKGHEFRLTVLYFSGDLSRGYMHIRAVIEDVIPSVARDLERIVEALSRDAAPKVQRMLGMQQLSPQVANRYGSLPALLANAYGPGYVWTATQAAFHRQPLSTDRMYRWIAMRLAERANKKEFWGIREELVYLFVLREFFHKYEQTILQQKEGVEPLSAWRDLIAKYHAAALTEEDLRSIDALAFVTGLLTRQFSNSYYVKTTKAFVEHRIMRFGTKLRARDIWTKGVEVMKPLSLQWDLGLSESYHKALPLVAIGLVEAERSNRLADEEDAFLTMFWAGHEMYQKPDKEA